MKRIQLLMLVMCVAVSPLLAQSVSTDLQSNVARIKELVQTNAQQATEEINQLLKGKNKKDPDLLVAIGRVYLDAGKSSDAEIYLDQAKKVNNKYPAVYLLEGDIALSKKDGGAACQFYEQAIYFDPNCKEAYLKYAHVYKEANPEQAIEMLLRLKEIAPDYLPADKELADVYYKSNQFAKAIEVYARFINSPEATEDDMLKYAFALFLNHDFTKSLEITQLGLQRNSHYAPFNRLAMYNYTDLKLYEQGLKAADDFFNHSDNPDFSYLDYMYYGHLLSVSKKYDEAIVQYEKALKLDSLKTDLWREISNAYENMSNYVSAIDSYKKYFASFTADLQTPDLLFQLGKLYYEEGTMPALQDLAIKKTSLVEADSVFSIIVEKVPESYLGLFWRARANSALDSETTQGLAKPYYEATLSLLAGKNEARYNPVIIECYSYLGYYYLINNKLLQSKEYWTKILSIDPTNSTAKKALAGIK
ncbi:tetratricopeptide repeat protein [uncultured Bacteroides sp.]|uniref:tetratricopeptide repeat protein n=1 Tax=uncultured Bacteroides sp. TaxID=162156 RepID=UPI002AA68F59|nr:tetratricopeptide repeat protein [uncultured Bacteroides sp.]